jgi:hypothetical protein
VNGRVETSLPFMRIPIVFNDDGDQAMFNLKIIAVAAALALSPVGMAIADESPLDALSSAATVSFKTVSGPELTPSLSSSAESNEAVDLDSLKARIQGNPGLLAQLQNYGATLDDVVGITGTDETDVTILVRG